MYHAKHIRLNGKILTQRLALLLSVIMLFWSTYNFAEIIYAAEDSRKLLNGSFEEEQTWTSSYSQLDQSKVPSWNTTAFQGKIELFTENTGTYIPGVKLTPTNGTYAAELNADEESTLYQNVKTTPSSVYEWGLDHGGRNGTDTMALVIGPKQSVDPSKPSKAGRDQLMQMVDWLIEQGMTSVKTSAGLGENLTVYSKKFAEQGTFENNAANDAFSLTPSTIYTEEWHIWIMASSKVTSGTNPWNSYGSNADSSASSGSGEGGSEVDLSKYYFYTVPAGQTETLFGFVSVGYVNSSVSGDKAKTYGNFLDNINFKLFHPLSGSTTNHGSAVIGGSDGSVGGEGASDGHEVTVDNNLKTYVTDGETLKIQAVIKAADAADGCQFVGVYYTKQDDEGNPVAEFIKVTGNEIEDTGSLTDEEKKGKWVKSTNEAGDIIYTYYLENLTSSTDLHFIFIKNPTVTYDPNGGKPYIIEDRPHLDEDPNVYSFKPTSDTVNAESFVKPYVSHAAEGQNDGWKFLGWKLMGDIVDNIPAETELINAGNLGSLLLPAEHTIACDYSVNGATDERAAQYFKIYDGNVALTKSVTEANEIVSGVTWNDTGEEKLYANVHKGITMVAQWRWRQAFIPQLDVDGVFTDSTDGGTVEITSVIDPSDDNYNDAYNENGGKSYHASIDERITVKATAKSGCKFIGWYDEEGNLITTNAEYGYVETKESVKTYYARFSNTVTQTYIRQIKNGDVWQDTTDNKIGTLERYSYTDVVGMPISTTATAAKGYKFVGWYDSDGNKVADSMLINGVTLSYVTTGDATYYARFEDAYTLVVSKIDGDNSTEDNKVPIAGAEFTLYQKDDSGSKTIVYQGESIKCTVIGSAVTALNSAGTKAVAVFQDKLDPEKDYYLAEIKAPSGYRMLDEPVKITINGSGDTALIDGIETAFSEKEVNIELANYLTLQMPTAGIKSTGSWFTAAGLSLLFVATIGLFVLKTSQLKRKNK
ncbi:MAG: prealbumin-like fold domain-containing protein [Acutalibacteraceae bacterium]